MINFNYIEIDFVLKNTNEISNWISKVITDEDFKEGDINYVFCSDSYLHKINIEFLSHDTFTDIISFDYSIGEILHGDIFISIDRIIENAKQYNTPFNQELYRVIIHGVLHYCGYKDHSEKDKVIMRTKEDFYLKTLNL